MRYHHSLDIRGSPRPTKLHWAGRRGLCHLYRGRRSPRLHWSGCTSAQCHRTLQFTRTPRRTTGEVTTSKGRPQHIREHCRRVAKTTAPGDCRGSNTSPSTIDEIHCREQSEDSSLSLSLSLLSLPSPSSHFFAHIHLLPLLFPILSQSTLASQHLHCRGDKTKIDTRIT
jgi:hypothetical protein